jgi:uncharacterized protein (DUF736 family)
VIAIEAAMDAARYREGDDHGYHRQLHQVGKWLQRIGQDRTVSVKAKITPAVKESEKAPDFRVFAGQSEFGAAWKRTSSAGREYLSVKLDDPSFPAPVFATLVDTEDDGFVLIWSRRDVE